MGDPILANLCIDQTPAGKPSGIESVKATKGELAKAGPVGSDHPETAVLVGGGLEENRIVPRRIEIPNDVLGA